MPFKKGQSGNPSGRKRKSAEEVKQEVELKALAKAYTLEALERLLHWMRTDNPKASVTAATAVLDRGHGKPLQQIDMDVNMKECDVSSEPLPQAQWDQQYGPKDTVQ